MLYCLRWALVGLQPTVISHRFARAAPAPRAKGNLTGDARLDFFKFERARASRLLGCYQPNNEKA